MRPRPLALIAALFTTTVIVSGVFGWLAWRLIGQQHAIDEQRARDRLGRSADATSARIGERFAAAGEHLAALASGDPASPRLAGTVTLTISADGSMVSPRGALPFVPFTRPVAPVRSAALAGAEAVELRDNDPARALTAYRTLARSDDLRLKAVALVRLAAIQRKSGDATSALESYRALARLGDVPAEHLPAALVGLYGQHATLREMRNESERAAMAVRLTETLDRGEWMLTRGAAELYRDEFPAAKPASWRMAAAIDDLWRERGDRLPPRGHLIVESTLSPMLILWRASDARVVVLAAFTDTFFDDLHPTASGWRLTAADGRVVVADGQPSGTGVSQIVSLPDFPLTLQLWDREIDQAGGWRRIQLAALAAMLLFLWSTTWLMARAIRREAVAARLQSEFVAAVSHEFRSPASTIRQMAEMLATGRVGNDERRQKYYAMLSSEAARLQRLVETLLDFGRMEAGAERYTVGDVPIARVVERVLTELQPQLADSPRRIDVEGAVDAAVRADEPALTLALRNLVDNALKYSPADAAISVRWEQAGDRLRLAVADRGPGIPEPEQRVIFERFVRGRGAIDRSVRGTGLGLAMVRQIAVAHGGDVLLDSVPGRGSTFTLVLPATAAVRPPLSDSAADIQRA